MNEAGNDLNIDVGIGLNKLVKSIAASEARIAKMAAKSEKLFKTANTNAAGSFKKIDRAIGRSDRAANRFARGGARNLSLQLSQVAQQGAVTGDFLRAFAIQLPDMAIGFGAVGIAIGAVAGVLGPLALDFIFAGDKTEEAKEKAEAFSKALDDTKAAIGRADAALRLASAGGLEEVKELYGAATTKAMKLVGALADIEVLAAKTQAQDALKGLFDDEFGTKLGDSIGGVAAAVLDTTSEEIEVMKSEVAALEQQIAAAISPNPDQVNLLVEMREELALVLGQIENAPSLSEEFKVDPADIDRIRELSILIPKALAEENFLGAANMISELRERMHAVGVEVREGFGTELTHIEDLLRQTNRLLQDAEANADGVSGAAGGIAGSLSPAVAQAAALADQLRISLDLAQAILGNSDRLQRRANAISTPVGLNPFPVEELPEKGVVVNPSTPPRPARGGGGGSRGRSRGGGGGRSAATQSDVLEIAEKEIQALERQIEMLGKTDVQVAELTLKYRLLDEAKRKGIPITAELTKKIDEQAQAFGNLSEAYEQQRINQERYEQAVGDISDALAGALVSGENFRESMAQIFAQLAKDIISSGIRQAILGQFPSISGGGGGGNFLSNIFSGLFKGIPGFAKGTDYAPGGVAMVGEDGPELVNLPRGSQVIPNNLLSQLQVPTLGQIQPMQMRAAPAPNVNVPEPKVTVVVLDNPDKIGQYLNTPEGEMVFVDLADRNGLR